MVLPFRKRTTIFKGLAHITVNMNVVYLHGVLCFDKTCAESTWLYVMFYCRYVYVCVGVR